MTHIHRLLYCHQSRSNIDMKGLFLPIFAILGISLFSYDSLSYKIFNFIPFAISVSDLVVIFLMFYSLVKLKFLEKSSILFAAVLLTFALLFSGLFNEINYPLFNFSNFVVNYIRVIGLVAIVLLLPPLFREIGQERLAKAMLWIIRLHCIILLFDAFRVIPIEWLPASTPGESRAARAAGLFYEPGWFGIWIGLSFFYILQLQKNHQKVYIKSTDLFLITISLISSTGIRGILIFGVAISIMFFSKKLSDQLKLAGSFIFIFILLSIGGKYFLPSFVDINHDQNIASLEYVEERLSRVLTTDIEDGSTIDRLDSLSVSVPYVFNNSPLLGIGLGGDNWQVLPDYNDGFGVSGSSILLASVFISGGLISLLIFIYIGLNILFNLKTFIFGVGLLTTSIVWGGAYDVFIWFFIALAIEIINSSTEKKLT